VDGRRGFPGAPKEWSKNPIATTGLDGGHRTKSADRTREARQLEATPQSKGSAPCEPTPIPKRRLTANGAQSGTPKGPGKKGHSNAPTLAGGENAKRKSPVGRCPRQMLPVQTG